jgi:hypothetical protein
METKRPSAAVLRLPDFLYVGAAKSGSSWIYEVLRNHPEVYVPPAKDIQFFDKNYHRGINWYASFFADVGATQKCGELSHDYFFDRAYAERIAEHIPQVKVLACLRNPAERIISHYHYARTVFVDHRETLESFSNSDKAVKGSDYLNNLRPFYELFPRENIRILFFDDLRNHPERFAADVYQFIGVDASFRAPNVLRPERVSRTSRTNWLSHRAYSTAQLLRRLGGQNIVGAFKRSPLFNRLLFVPAAKPAVDPSLRRALQQRYLPMYDKLEELINAPLPDSWRSSAP